MDIKGNTILITGGGSGIGRGLAEALHKAGNQVIIAGRRQHALDEVTGVNPGMKSLTLDVENPEAVNAFAERLTARFPALNVLINNAGIMKIELVRDKPADTSIAEATITTNLLGPIRLTAALLPHFLKQKAATIVNVTSGLAFVPYAVAPSYSATKAAMHAYSVVLRHQLKGTPVEVLELAPPYVQTELTGEGQARDPRAMPLKEFVDETMSILKGTIPGGEIIVDRCKPLRHAERDGKFDEIFTMLANMAH